MTTPEGSPADRHIAADTDARVAAAIEILTKPYHTSRQKYEDLKKVIGIDHHVYPEVVTKTAGEVLSAELTRLQCELTAQLPPSPSALSAELERIKSSHRVQLRDLANERDTLRGQLAAANQRISEQNKFVNEAIERHLELEDENARLRTIIEPLRVSPPADGEDAEQELTCIKCGEWYELQHGDEPTPECHRCAQKLLTEARAKIAEYEAALATREADGTIFDSGEERNDAVSRDNVRPLSPI